MGKILKEDIKYISIHPNTFAHIAKSVYGRIIAGDLGDADVEEFGTGILFRFNGVGVNFNKDRKENEVFFYLQNGDIATVELKNLDYALALPFRALLGLE